MIMNYMMYIRNMKDVVLDFLDSKHMIVNVMFGSTFWGVSYFYDFLDGSKLSLTTMLSLILFSGLMEIANGIMCGYKLKKHKRETEIFTDKQIELFKKDKFTGAMLLKAVSRVPVIFWILSISHGLNDQALFKEINMYSFVYGGAASSLFIQAFENVIKIGILPRDFYDLLADLRQYTTKKIIKQEKEH